MADYPDDRAALNPAEIPDDEIRLAHVYLSTLTPKARLDFLSRFYAALAERKQREGR
jgi:hypothetical protein